MSTSLSPQLCLTREDIEYLRRHDKFADQHSYVTDIVSLFVFVFLLVLSILNLWSLPEFNIYYHYLDISFFLISFGALIYICVHLDTKRKVEAIRKKINKC